MTSLPPRLTELTTSPEACDAAWKTCDSLLLSAPANRMAMNVTPAFPVMSAATATLTSAAVRPSALIALLKSALELWPRNCSPFMLSFWRVTPPNELGRTASRFVSWLGSPMLGRTPLAAAAALWDGATLGSGDGEADGATEAAAAGADLRRRQQDMRDCGCAEGSCRNLVASRTDSRCADAPGSKACRWFAADLGGAELPGLATVSY